MRCILGYGIKALKLSISELLPKVTIKTLPQISGLRNINNINNKNIIHYPLDDIYND